MILVDIQIPAVNRICDFELDEEIPVGEIIEKAAHLAAFAEGMQVCGSDKMYLYAVGINTEIKIQPRESLLDKTLSLGQQGIQSGETLVLF